MQKDEKTMKETIEMSRQERKNMMEFIEKVKGIDKMELMYMTDADIEHIYDTTYYHVEEIVE